jgi:hypothetical protein
LPKKKSISKVKRKPPNLKPSEVHNEPWIYVERKKGRYPEPTDNSGKWLVTVYNENLDLVWKNIRMETEAGKLGFASKTSTAMPSPLIIKQGLGMICVYTYDFTDTADVMRVREALRIIGITHKIGYKSDNATLARQYSFLKKGRVCIHWE